MFGVMTPNVSLDEYLHRSAAFLRHNQLINALNEVLKGLICAQSGPYYDYKYLRKILRLILFPLASQNSHSTYPLPVDTIRRGELFRVITKLAPDEQQKIFTQCLDESTALGKRFHLNDSKFHDKIQRKLNELKDQRDKGFNLEEQLALADSYFEREDYAMAISAYSEALKKNFICSSAYHGRGTSHSKMGNLHAAIRDLDEAINLNPFYVYSLINRGKCHLDLGHIEQAIKDLERAIKLDNSYCCTYLYLGMAHLKKKDLILALKNFIYAMDATIQSEYENKLTTDHFYQVLKKLCDKESMQYHDLPEKMFRRGTLFRAISKLKPSQQKEIFSLCLDQSTILGKRFHLKDLTFKKMIADKLKKLDDFPPEKKPSISSPPKLFVLMDDDDEEAHQIEELDIEDSDEVEKSGLSLFGKK